jgi:hypothetical protein
VVRQSIPRERGEASPQPSTRELVCDDRFCELLAADMQVKTSTVRTALHGEAKVRAIRLTEWVLRNAPDDPERRGKLLVWWAKKRGAGAFRPDDGQDESLSGILENEEERFGRLAEALARMWVENPASLAEAIRALEQERNGNGRS